METKTQDLSCEGFSCISERWFPVHQVLECDLVIPGEKVGRPMCRNLVLRGRAEVVRVVANGNGGAFNLACRYEEYAIHDSRSRELGYPKAPVSVSARHHRP
jgi:hypothetical protein